MSTVDDYCQHSLDVLERIRSELREVRNPRFFTVKANPPYVLRVASASREIKEIGVIETIDNERNSIDTQIEIAIEHIKIVCKK
jgi:hypothetical protein